MRQAVGFRNVLLHEYARVDDEIVLQRSPTPLTSASSVAPSSSG